MPVMHAYDTLLPANKFLTLLYFTKLLFMFDFTVHLQLIESVKGDFITEWTLETIPLF